MANVKLDAYRIAKLQFCNEVIDTDKENLEINSMIKTSVNYDEDNKKCLCSYLLEMRPKETDVDFKIEVKVVGSFSYDGDDKKAIHVEAAKKLYPFLQSSTSSLMAIIGIPNFILPDFDISEDDVINE